MGWGFGPWGAVEWGGGTIAELRLLGAQPYRENVVRLTFNVAPAFVGDLGPNDAYDPDRYDIVPIAGTMPDGSDPRPVYPIVIESVPLAGSLGTIVDVTVDRRFSPYPAQYRISVNQLVSVYGGILTATSAQFDGMLQGEPPPRRDLKVPSRDIANPQTRSALFDPLPVTDDELILGTIPVDDQGDYAFDEGITNLKKRIFRRVVTRKGAFAHLPEYGVGLPQQLKRLSTVSARAELAAETQKQIAEEPDVERVAVRVIADPQKPSLFRLRIRVKAKVSEAPVDVDVPFSPIGGGP